MCISPMRSPAWNAGKLGVNTVTYGNVEISIAALASRSIVPMSRMSLRVSHSNSSLVVARDLHKSVFDFRIG